MISNASNSNRTTEQPRKRTGLRKGYKVWHLALTVPAIAVTLQLMLGSLAPLPQAHNPYATHLATAKQYNPRALKNLYPKPRENDLPEIDILPLNLRGEMTGPVLANVIEEYFPESTEQHAADLRDTMPPSDNPRIIVILPKGEDDEPVF